MTANLSHTETDVQTTNLGTQDVPKTIAAAVNADRLQKWESSPLSDELRGATIIEKQRGSHMIRALENEGIEKYRAIDFATEFGGLFVLDVLDDEIISEKIHGCGPKTIKALPSENVDYYIPDDWIATTTQNPVSAIQYLFAPCGYADPTQATTVSLIQTDDSQFAVTLNPKDTPADHAFLLTDPAGYDPESAVDIADVAISVVSETEGFSYKHDAKALIDKLGTMAPPPALPDQSE